MSTGLPELSRDFVENAGGGPPHCPQVAGRAAHKLARRNAARPPSARGVRGEGGGEWEVAGGYYY